MGTSGPQLLGLLDRLNELGISYRWVCRYLPLDKEDARKAVTVAAAAPLIDFANANTYNDATSVTVFDAKGQDVALTYYFQKSATDTWNVYVTANGTPISTTGAGVPAPSGPAAAGRASGPLHRRHRAGARHFPQARVGTYPRRGTCTRTPLPSPRARRAAANAIAGKRAALAPGSRAKA